MEWLQTSFIFYSGRWEDVMLSEMLLAICLLFSMLSIPQWDWLLWHLVVVNTMTVISTVYIFLEFTVHTVCLMLSIGHSFVGENSEVLLKDALWFIFIFLIFLIFFQHCWCHGGMSVTCKDVKRQWRRQLTSVHSWLLHWRITWILAI